MQTADSTPGITLLSSFPERIQAALKDYAIAVDLSPEAVVRLAIGYFLESADINISADEQDSVAVSSQQNGLAHLPLALQKGIEQYAAEIEFPPESVIELAITFFLDPDASNFEDCQVGVQREQVALLQQYCELQQIKAA